MEEVFKDIKGFEGAYQISNFGNVKSLAKSWLNGTRSKGETLLKQQSHLGYLNVILCIDGVKTRHLIHRLVAKEFIDNSENKPQVNHINGIKTDNRVENLEWATSRENINHSWKNGLSRMTEKMRLSASKVGKKYNTKVIIDLNTGVFYDSVRELSDLLGVNYSTLRSQLNGNNPNKTSFIYA